MTILSDFGTHLRHSHAITVGGGTGFLAGIATDGLEPLHRIAWTIGTTLLGVVVAFFANAAMRRWFPLLAREGRAEDDARERGRTARANEREATADVRDRMKAQDDEGRRP